MSYEEKYLPTALLTTDFWDRTQRKTIETNAYQRDYSGLSIIVQRRERISELPCARRGHNALSARARRLDRPNLVARRFLFLKKKYQLRRFIDFISDAKDRSC